ncbi:2-isopropylmalate synthase (Alpha-isopropylmalate synthase) (Alpha-IPM synthetase) [Pestalotiopsis sp. IQ-011]
MAHDPRLATLLGTVPELTNALSTATNITVIAPSNAAFQKAMAAMPGLAEMVKNTTFLTDLLEYHVVQGLVSSSMFSTTPIFASTALQITSTGGAKSQMVELIKSNADALVVSGFKQVSRVTKADLFFNGGVLHIVDTILTEPDVTSVTALDVGLTSMAGALAKANMTTGVDGLRDATIFAPSNAAFVQVGNVLEAAGPDLLSEVLGYHIVEGGAVHSSELLKRVSAGGGTVQLSTLEGYTLAVREVNGQLYVNNAKIELADVLTQNGVVHVINDVLNPHATTAVPDASKATPVADFAGASPVREAPFTSAVTPTTTLVPVTIAMAAGHAAMPTAALMGAVGAAAAVFANL